MLGKLIKYEFKATARIYLPFFVLLVLLTGVNRLFIEIGGAGYTPQYMKIPSIVTVILYFVALAAVFVITMVATIQRFYKNFMTDEGYLMFTLPVTKDRLILSKLIVAVIWNILSTVIAALSLFFLFIDGKLWGELWTGVSATAARAAENGINLPLLVAIGLLTLLVGIVSGILQMYASIVIGCLSSRHKLILGLGAYWGFSMVTQIASLLVMPYVTNWLSDITNQGGNPSALQIVQFVQGTLLFSMALAVVFGVAYYVVTRLMLKKKLNLE